MWSGANLRALECASGDNVGRELEGGGEQRGASTVEDTVLPWTTVYASEDLEEQGKWIQRGNQTCMLPHLQVC